MKWIHQRGVTDINLMSDISKVLRERLHEIGEIRLPDVRDEFHVRNLKRVKEICFTSET